jgi:small-conductance mechanosensitive channel
MDRLENAWAELVDWATGRMPDALLAAIVVGAGYLVARLARGLTDRLLRRFSLRLVALVERAARRRGVPSELSAQQAELVTGAIAGRIVFWLVFALFLAAATAAVGIPVMSTWLAGFASYLPRVLAAGGIILLGILVSHLLRVVILSAATSAGGRHSSALARAAQGAVVAVAVVIAVEELGIETTLLTVLATTILGAMLGGCALAFGLGARREVSNLVACHYLSRIYGVGHRVRVAGHEGVIAEISPTSVLLETREGRVVIPAHRFSEEVTILLAAE